MPLVIPFAAGSDPDQVARTMTQVGSERTGEPVAIHHVPACHVPARHVPTRQGYVAAREVATAAPDGPVLRLTTTNLLERPPKTSDEPFAPTPASAVDCTPLARVGLRPFVSLFPPGMFGRWLPRKA